MTDKGMYEDVAEFNSKFGLPMPSNITPLDRETMKYRINFMLEELTEIMEAEERGDLVEIADGLVDLVYVALGTAIFMGLPWHELWAEVHKTNMLKERCENPEDSKRKNKFDIIKPPGWRSPDLQSILVRYLKDLYDEDGRKIT